MQQVESPPERNREILTLGDNKAGFGSDHSQVRVKTVPVYICELGVGRLRSGGGEGQATAARQSGAGRRPVAGLGLADHFGGTIVLASARSCSVSQPIGPLAFMVGGRFVAAGLGICSGVGAAAPRGQATVEEGLVAGARFRTQPARRTLSPGRHA